MQFKYPELLYALFALLIPVFIHLFQLQRFTKTPFTNVQFLKEIELQTRKSSRLKKWLVLLARLGIFASIIIAFAQPYFSQNKNSEEVHTILYLDNSISMQTKGNQGELLKRTIQDIIENISKKGTYSLLLNNNNYPDLSSKLLVERLKNTKYSIVQKNLSTVLLQTENIIRAKPTQQHNIIFISDFQKNKTEQIPSTLTESKIPIDLVQLSTKNNFNISIDNVFVSENNIDNILLNIQLSHQGENSQNVGVVALQNKVILAKNSIDIKANETKNIVLRIPNKVKNISLRIDTEDAYLFDNIFHISFNQHYKTKILAIGKTHSFLEKIYTKEEFIFTQKESNQISYQEIDKQQLIILNEVVDIPKDLGNKLHEFVKTGGSLVIIPNKNNKKDKLNIFLNQLKIGSINQILKDSLEVTKIHFSHPILKNVFDREVTNFQYPKVNNYFKGVFNGERSLLSFENQETFIGEIKKEKGRVFWVASPLSLQSSDFTKAPLIVPIFYNIAKQSSSQSQLSYRLGEKNEILIHQKLETDEILHIIGKESDFIPRQEIQTEKVLLYTEKQPNKTGFYEVKYNEKNLYNIAYNQNNYESNFTFLDFKNIKNSYIKTHTNTKEVLSELVKQQQINSYFKWFVLLALLFVMIEILLIKYL